MSVERNLDFDRIIPRVGTDSLKYDFAVQRGRPADVLPLWVADMDFPTSGFVTDAIIRRTEHGIFGYTETGADYFQALDQWMQTHHGWELQPEWLIKTPGVVFALAAAVRAYTAPGEAVLIQQPVYYPFSEVIRDNGRVVVSNDLVLKDGRYQMDLSDLEQKILEHHIRLLLLCSPHNPVGRVWTAEELYALGAICRRHGVVVVSDEIHQDFVYAPHRHTVYATLGPDFAQQCVICTSPGKTFNLAGLQVSNILIPNPALRRQFKKQVDAAGYSQMNTLGLTACRAAYAHGEEWYQAMLSYLQGNLDLVRSYLATELPEITLIDPEGTYLLWLDFRKLSMTESRREQLLLKEAKLWLDSGAMFGPIGEGFERINIACPKALLQQALHRLKAAIQNIRQEESPHGIRL